MAFETYFGHMQRPSQILERNMMECFKELVKHEMHFKNDFAKDTTSSLPSTIDMFLSQGSFIAVEHHEGIIKAICSVTLMRFGFNYAHVSFFYVPERYRGKGYGTKLINNVQEVVTEQFGCRYLQLTVMPNNERAIEFYKKEGFEPHVIGMSKNLAKGK